MNDNNRSEPATKGDLIDGLAEVETKLTTKIDSVRTELKLDIAALDKKIDCVEQRLDQKIDSVEQRLNEKIEKVYSSQIQADARLENKMDKMMDKMDKLYSNTMSSYEKTVLKGEKYDQKALTHADICLLYTSPSPRDRQKSRMPSSA